MSIQPYLFFDGCCEDAVKYYEKHLGATITMLTRYKDAPPGDSMAAQADGNKVMHCSLSIGDSVVMASDDCMNPEPKFQGFSLSLTVADNAAADRAFAALTDGGQVHMPLGKTFFSPYFGMATDRFGVSWMVIIPPR